MAMPVLTRFSNDFRRDMAPRRGPARLLTGFALFWLVSAAFHAAVFALDDRAWSGALSWRKPIVFSISIGLLLWTFGWVLDRLPNRPRPAWVLAVTMALASTIETVLIILQTWRGRASHFNISSAGDSLIFQIMGLLVGIMSLMLVALFIWTLRRRPADPLDRLVAIAGLAIIMTGLGTGQWLVGLGAAYVQQFGTVPDQVINGEAGVVKYPHAVAFHGIQVFMVAAMLLGRSMLPTRRAGLVMRAVVATYVGVLAFALLQTVRGRATFDLDIVAAALLVLSVAGLATALLVSFVAWWDAASDGDSEGSAATEPTTGLVDGSPLPLTK